jgi:hypothetical protein
MQFSPHNLVFLFERLSVYKNKEPRTISSSIVRAVVEYQAVLVETDAAIAHGSCPETAGIRARETS